jgi:L-lactate dehydrogenase complex protein LldF
VLDHLDHYLERLADAVEGLGGHVHFAADAAEANRIVTDLARAEGVRTVVKRSRCSRRRSASTTALASAGVAAIETDLGEYILQLGGDVPSHIIGRRCTGPASASRGCSHEHLGTPPDADPEALTRAPRAALRRAFLRADMGVTGVNFAVAESGTVVLVENEGNIRLATSAPRCTWP